jgi:protein-disulfide isomerase
MARTAKAVTSTPVMTSVDSPYSFQSVINFINRNFGILLLITLAFLAGFVLGSMWTESNLLKKGGLPTAAGQPTAADPLADTGPTADQLAQVPEVTDRDHIIGNKNAKVVLIEYSDFECPFCARFHPTMEEVREKYGNDVAWVYRHFPLSFHPQADPSAQVSECVSELAGKDAFWKYADAIFTINRDNGGITKEDVLAAAVTAGANRSAVEACLNSGKFKEYVAEDMAGGTKAGITGTPGTIVVSDGQYELISGALPVDQINATIDKYLE